MSSDIFIFTSQVKVDTRLSYNILIQSSKHDLNTDINRTH